MPLALPAVLPLLAACAPAVAPGTMLPLVRVESRLDPLAIGVNGQHPRQLHPGTRAEAATMARRLLERGQNVDLGLAQINSANLARLGLSVEHAFDPCANLAAAGRLLQSAYSLTSRRAGGPRRAVLEALSIYNTGRPDRGFRNGYVAKVSAAAGVATTPPEPALKPPPETSAPAWVVFAPSRPASSFVFTAHTLGDRP
jgi:type IV secretion system protein VirB1